MGIFSFLNRDYDYEEIDLTPAEPEEEAGPGLPDLCREMPIEIVEPSGRVLNTGLITARSGTVITMGRHHCSSSARRAARCMSGAATAR